MDIRTVSVMVKEIKGRTKMEYRKCIECGQHISHFEGNMCDHCEGRK